MKKLFIFLLILLSCPIFSQEIINNCEPKTIFTKEKTPYVYISIIIKTGIVSEATYNAGMGSFISQFLTYQTKSSSHEELQEVFYSSGCRISQEINLDYLEIKAITLKETFPQAIDIIGECLTETKINKDILEKAKVETLKKFTQDYDNPFQRLYDTMRMNMYVSNPYKKSLYGTYQSIKNIDKSNIVRYYRENFQKSNIVISIIGDLDPQNISDSIENAFFVGQKVKKRNLYEYNEELKSNKIIDVEPYDNNDKLSYLVLGYLAPSVQDKDFYAYLVLSTFLGEGKSSYVFQNIRQKFGIGYFIGFNFEKLKRQSHSYLYLSCLDDGTKMSFAKDEFLKEIENIKLNGIPEKDLNKAKTYVIEQENIKNLNLLTKAHNIAWNEAINGSFNKFNDFSKEISKVSNEDIKKVANKYFEYYIEVKIKNE